MNKSLPIIYSINKFKVALYLLGAILLVAAGILVLYNCLHEQGRYLLGSIELTYGIAILAILFFGYASVMFISKLFSNKPGIVINEQGIFENATAVVNGLIPWQDITSVELYKMQSQKFVLVYVKNPEEYIAKQKNIIKKKSMQANLKTHGTSIFINTNMLNVSDIELAIVIKQQLDKNMLK
ncbi:STM3941 family protein [Myroides odoratimimus]|uniref:STM3941 family protein n=1 Tax=Myroides odoratimimus TaxID=76832 RepID=UPI00310163EA